MSPSIAADRRLASPGAPIAALGGAMISFQVGASFAKGLFPLAGVEGTTALRVGFSALILALVFRPWRAKLDRKTAPALVAYGASLGLMNLVFYSALRTIPLGVAVALEFTGPLAVAVASSRRWIDFAWIGLAAIGILLLSPLWRSAHPIDPKGALLALGAGVFWALYVIFGQKAGADHGAKTTALGAIVAAVIIVPIGLAHQGLALFSPALLPIAMLVAVLSSALPYSLEMVALTRLPARVYGTLASGDPALAALVGFALLHEHLSLPQWLGIGAIVCASVGTALTIRHPHPVPRD